MLTAFAIVVVFAVPFVALFALFAWTDRRQRRRRDVEARQIAMMECIHERLGAVAAPIVRRRRDRWQVQIAVPADRPGLTKALLAIISETVAPPDGHRRSLEIVVTRQPAAGGLRWESLPCT